MPTLQDSSLTTRRGDLYLAVLWWIAALLLAFGVGMFAGCTAMRMNRTADGDMAMFELDLHPLGSRDAKDWKASGTDKTSKVEVVGETSSSSLSLADLAGFVNTVRAGPAAPTTRP